MLAAKEGEEPTATPLDINQNQKTNFVLAKDGNAYTLEATSEGNYLVKINKDFTVEKTLLAFQPAKSSYSTPTIGMVASESENIIYIVSNDGAIYLSLIHI